MLILTNSKEQYRHFMAAIDSLNSNITALTASVTALTVAVAAAIPDINPLPGTGATEAQVQNAANLVQAQQQAVDVQTAAINKAVNPPVTGTIPAAPTGVVATSAGNGGVTLAFAAVPGATSYNVSRGTSPGTEVPVGSPSPTPGFTDTGLTVGTAYFYTVTATNASGTSPASAEVTVAA